MPSTFDPYYSWLAIPPEDQPPNHYLLLGVKVFESNSDVIDMAADRQMAHLRTFQDGPHAAFSQRLLNEVAKARVCLLNPSKKVAYDKSLRSIQTIVKATPLRSNTLLLPRAANLVQSPLSEAPTDSEEPFDIAGLVQQPPRMPKPFARPAKAVKSDSGGRKKVRISSTALTAIVAGSLALGAVVVLWTVLIVTKPPEPTVVAKTGPSQPPPKTNGSVPPRQPLPAKSPNQNVAGPRIASDPPPKPSNAGVVDRGGSTERVQDSGLPDKSTAAIDATSSAKPEGEQQSSQRAESENPDKQATTLPPEPKKKGFTLSAEDDLVFITDRPLDMLNHDKSDRRTPDGFIADFLSSSSFFSVTKDGAPPEHGFFNVDGKAVPVVWKSNFPKVVSVYQNGEPPPVGPVSFGFWSTGTAVVSVTVGEWSATKTVEVRRLRFGPGVSANEMISKYGMPDKKLQEFPDGVSSHGFVEIGNRHLLDESVERLTTALKSQNHEIWEYRAIPRCLILIVDSQVAGVFIRPATTTAVIDATSSAKPGGVVESGQRANSESVDKQDVPLPREPTKEELAQSAEARKQLGSAIGEIGTNSMPWEAKNSADTTAKAELLQADAAEDLRKRFNGKFLTMRFPIKNVEVAPSITGSYYVVVGDPDFCQFCRSRYDYKLGAMLLKLSKAEVLAIDKNSVLVVSGSIKATYGPRDPNALLVFSASRKASLNLSLDRAATKLGTGKWSERGGFDVFSDLPTVPVSEMYYTCDTLSNQNLLVTVHNTPFGDVKEVVEVDSPKGEERFRVNWNVGNPFVTIKFANGKVTGVQWDIRQLRQGAGKEPPAKPHSDAPVDTEALGQGTR